MADARTNSLRNAIFASDATTTIPETPAAGTTYRDESYNAAAAASGWPYYNVVNSANFNQIMFLVTSLLNDVEKAGILYWSAQTNYPIGAICRDNLDGQFYIARQANTAAQPSTSSTNWELVDFSNGSSWMKTDGSNVTPMPITPGSLTTGVDFITSMNYSNVASDGTRKWYRKWKSGWIEQGGFVNVTTGTYTEIVLATPFSDTDYIVTGALCGIYDSDRERGGGFEVKFSGSTASVPNSTVSTIYAYCHDGGNNTKRGQSLMWYAIGK